MTKDVENKLRMKNMFEMNVRKIVREVIRENVDLINERLMVVDEDVDYIYDTFFKKDIEDLNKTGIITKYMFDGHYITTYNLKSPLSKKAHAINPCDIQINIRDNFYSPNNSLIGVGVNKNAIDFVVDDFGGNLNSASEYFFNVGQLNLSRNIKSDFSESKIKGSIHHELAHWIDDTLHNQHIKKRATKASENGVGMNRKGLPINADKMEIQGQIHNVVQLKKQYSKEWDSLTFSDLIDLSPTLDTINNQLSGDVKKEWKLNLIKRMNREGLLGKNMTY